MSNDSLNEIREHIKSAVAVLHWKMPSIALAKSALRDALALLGEWHSADSSLKGTAKSQPCESASPANLQSSEICVITPADKWIKEFELSASPAEDYAPRYKVVGINRIREILHHLFNEETPKPVSLAQMREKLRGQARGDYTIHQVLDAAGVKYVD